MLDFYYDGRKRDWLGTFSFTVDGVTRECEIFTTYMMYDIPRLFACKDKEGQMYLVENVDETKTTCEWYAVPVSEEKLTLIENGTLPLNAAFDSHIVYDLFEDYEDGGQVYGSVIDGRQLKEEDLNAADVRLHIKESHR